MNYETQMLGKKILKMKIKKKKCLVLLKKSSILRTKKKGKGLKILIPKKVLQIFSVALVQVKAGNTSENLLSEICQIIYSLY